MPYKDKRQDYRMRVRRYHERRRELIDRLGGACALCGTPAEEARIELHHKPGTRRWQVRAAGMFRSIQLYERDAAAGLIAPLCEACHSRAEWRDCTQPEFFPVGISPIHSRAEARPF